MKFNDPEKLAGYVAHYFIKHGEKPEIPDADIGRFLRHPAACFVTVYVSGDLRGCIGNIRPAGPLGRSIINNAVYAVRDDIRFPRITSAELPRMSVDVSVLSPLVLYTPKNTGELLQYLDRVKPGLVIEKEGRNAVYLPQVWDQLPQPEEFLSSLSLKAGLSPDAWRTGATYYTFRTIQTETDVIA